MGLILRLSMIKNKDVALKNVLAHPIRIAETKLAGAKGLVSPLEIFGSNRKSAQGCDIGIKKDYDDIVNNLNKYSKQYHKISSLIEGNPTVKTPKNFKKGFLIKRQSIKI